MARGANYGSRTARNRVSGGGAAGGLAAPLNPSFSPNNIIIKEEGAQVATQVSSINFVGTASTVTASGSDITVTITAGSTYTDEDAQDAVGLILVDGATIDFTYNDGVPSITAEVKTASITEDMQVLANNTTQDVSITKHGYVPIAPNDTSKFLRGDGTWAIPSGSAGSGDVNPFSDGNITKPAAADFSIADDTTVGHGTGSKINLASRGVEFTNTFGAAATTQSLFYKAAISSTLGTETAYIASNHGGQNAKNWFYGLAVRDNAGKIDAFGIVFDQGVGNTVWQHATFTNISTAPTLSSFNGGAAACGRPIWLRLAKVSTNFVYSVSFNGETYDVVATVSATGFIGSTINDVGIILYNGMNNGSKIINLDCYSFTHS